MSMRSKPQNRSVIVSFANARRPSASNTSRITPKRTSRDNNFDTIQEQSPRENAKVEAFMAKETKMKKHKPGEKPNVEATRVYQQDGVIYKPIDAFCPR